MLCLLLLGSACLEFNRPRQYGIKCNRVGLLRFVWRSFSGFMLFLGPLVCSTCGDACDNW
jgi:hypothetical protein